MPAPKGNRNAEKAGVYSFLAIGRWPKGASYVSRQLNLLRRNLTDSVVDTDGEISTYKRSLIQSICRLEGCAVLLLRSLWKSEAVSHDSLRATTETIAGFLEARDRKIAKLGIDKAAADPLDALYGPKK